MNEKILEERFSQLRFLDKGLVPLKEIALNLKLSPRQIKRLIKKLRENNWNINVLFA